MTPTEASRAARWELTAPESWALTNGLGSSTQPFKLALTELLMRGALRLVEAEGWFGRKTALLVDGPRAGAPAEAALAPVWELYRGTKTKTTDAGTGVPVDDLARSARGRFGGVGAYVGKHVVPALAARGLVEWRPRTILFVFKTGHWQRTPAGEAKVAELQAILDEGQARMGGWLSDDPGRAIAYVGLAGAAILLAPSLFPQLRQLRDLSDASGSGDISSGDYSFGDDFDLDSLDSVDSALDAIDSGVDAGGGGDGGGDSGGGDSGGGDSGGGGDGGGSSD